MINPACLKLLVPTGNQRRGALCLLLAGLLFACSAPERHQTESSESEAAVQVPQGALDSGLLLVFVRQFSFAQNVDDVTSEGPFVDCVRDAVVKTRPNQAIVSFDTFHEGVFPHMDRRAVPRDPKYFSALLDSQDFRRAMRSLGVRYIAFVGGVVEVGPSGGGGCLGGGFGSACFGYWEWDKASHLAASVLDLHSPEAPQSFKAAASGTAWFALVGIIPLGLPSQPSSVACSLLGEDIAGYLAYEDAAP